MPAPVALQRALICRFGRFESGLVLLPGLGQREDCRRELVIAQNIVHHAKGGTPDRYPRPGQIPH